MPEKFVLGVREFCELWPGTVEVHLPRSDSMGTELDYRQWQEPELPCRFDLFDPRDTSTAVIRDPGQTTVLLLPHPDLLPVARTCLMHDIPLILVTELSLRTQLQILWTAATSLLHRLRSAAWHVMEYQRWTRIARRCAGVQCNGVPTFRHFRRVNRRSLLFFDTRSRAKDCATTEQVEQRIAAAQRRGFPRLVYTGRLVSIKGAEDLIQVAAELKARQFTFELWIAGDGDRRAAMEAQVQAAGLGSQVRFLGILDFKSQLLPMLMAEADLFVCPHVQGDPSCTYVETMSAGVPIIGYANEALRGLVEFAGVGRTVRMRSPAALASAIIDEWKAPGRVLAESLASLSFARKHSFEVEFQRRAEHILESRA